MTSEELRNWAAIASFPLAIGALYLVIRQLWQRSYADLYSQQQAITKLFLDNPELRPFFYSGEVCTDELLQVKCAILAEKIAVSFEFVWLILQNLPPDVQDGWVNFMRFIYRSSPALQSHIDIHYDWYELDMLQKIGYIPPAATAAQES